MGVEGVEDISSFTGKEGGEQGSRIAGEQEKGKGEGWGRRKEGEFGGRVNGEECTY